MDVEEQSLETAAERQDATDRTKGNRIKMGIQNQEEWRLSIALGCQRI